MHFSNDWLSRLMPQYGREGALKRNNGSAKSWGDFGKAGVMSMPKLISAIVGGFVAILFVAMAGAQEWQGAPPRVMTSFEVPLLSSPPSGFLSLPGGTVAKTTPNSTFEVIEQAKVGSLLGDQIWLRVRPIDESGISFTKPLPGAGGQCDDGCWAYSGRVDGPSNFVAAMQ